MTLAAQYRLINAAVADQRAHWWSGDQAHATVPTYLQEDTPDERALVS